MIFKHMLVALAISFDSLVSAGPAWRTSSGTSLVHELDRRAGLSGLAKYNLSSGAEILTPSDAGFASETLRWSAFAAPTFDIAFIPAEEKDISIALKYMTSHKVPFLTKGGGHGVSLSLEKVQNAVMINMEKFNSVVVHSDGTLTVGGGAKFSQLYEAAYNAGRELTLGSCPCVGATGATLGGGHGRLQGKHGLSADAVVKLRVALWDGTIVEASATENSDLFWAMRGAGHNYGVVIETTFQTYPADNDGLHYNADMFFPISSLEEIMNKINDLLPVDPAVAIDVLILSNTTTLETYISLNIVYAGPLKEGQALTKQFTNNRLFLNESLISWERLPYEAQGGAVLAACQDGPYTDLYSANTKRIDVAQARKMADSYTAFVQEHPAANFTLLFWEVFGMQAVTAQDDAASAVGNRDFSEVLFVLMAIYFDDAETEAIDSWAGDWRSQVADPKHSGYDRRYFYVNYAHDDETRESIYGYEPWRLQRLRKLKHKYDPHGAFNGFHPVQG